jgi:CubicO group peptidase (beta-lactamase class C family)
VRRTLLFAAALFLISTSEAPAQALPRATPEELGFNPAKLARVEERLKQEVADGHVAGASAIVLREGQVALLATAGMADREANKPMRADTIVRIASMSKPVTSVAVMMLVDEGKLALEDPLAKHLPEFEHMQVVASASGSSATAARVCEPASGPITIRQLLTHTSGISYRFVNDSKVGALYIDAAIADGLSETPGTMAENVRRIARLPLAFQPGAQWHYGLNTDVLGRVVEVVSGQTLDAFLRERLFDPLRMNDTHFIVPVEKRQRVAVVYGIEGGKPLERLTSVLNQRGALVYSTTFPFWDDNAGYFSGGAGLVSTLNDYARFLQMLLNGGQLDGVRLLKPETVEAMTTNQIGALRLGEGGMGAGFGYGFGVVMPGQTTHMPAGTYSWAGFFATLFWVDPKNKVIGILYTQTYPAGETTLGQDFQRLTYEAIAP